VLGIIGPIPESLYKKCKLASNFFTREGLIYQSPEKDKNLNESIPRRKKIQILIPKRTSLKYRLKVEDANFLGFIKALLELDPEKRPSAKDALNHPWLTESVYPDN